jgi:hypothetical protein
MKFMIINIPSRQFLSQMKVFRVTETVLPKKVNLPFLLQFLRRRCNFRVD